MAKITSQTIEIKVCAHDSFSPVTLTQTIELAPNETAVPEELEKWCLEHMRTVAVAYAKAISKDIAPTVPTPQPNVNVQYTYGNQAPQGSIPANAGYQAPQGNYQAPHGSYQGQQQGGYPQGGYNEIDALLSTQVPPEFFGNTKPAAVATYGFTLRACSNKELRFLAYESKKAKNHLVGCNARRLLELGYNGN